MRASMLEVGKGGLACPALGCRLDNEGFWLEFIDISRMRSPPSSPPGVTHDASVAGLLAHGRSYSTLALEVLHRAFVLFRGFARIKRP